MKIRTLEIPAVLVVVVAAAALVMPAVAVEDGGEVPTAGNCLSFPVIWAEGVEKNLRGTPGMEPDLGDVWYTGGKQTLLPVILMSAFGIPIGSYFVTTVLRGHGIPV